MHRRTLLKAGLLVPGPRLPRRRQRAGDALWIGTSNGGDADRIVRLTFG